MCPVRPPAGPKHRGRDVVRIDLHHLPRAAGVLAEAAVLRRCRAFGDDDLEIADHLLDRLIDEVPQIREAMGADIADHAGAGLCLVVTPGEGDFRSAQKVSAEGAAVIARFADLAVRTSRRARDWTGFLM